MRGAILFLLLLLGGCGYSVTGRGLASAVPQPVVVRTFENRTLFPSLEAILADSVTRELAFRGISVAGEGESVIEGRVEAYTSDPASYSRTDTIAEYRASVTAGFAMRDRGGNPIWKGKITRSRVYPALTDVQLRRNAEEAAVRDICRDIASDLQLSISQRF